MSITIRQVAPDEHERTGQIVLAAYDAVGTIDGSYRDFMADTGVRVADGALVWVAVDDQTGHLLGTVTYSELGELHFEHRGHGDAGFRLLAVDPIAQGQGVGRLLVQRCIEEARSRGRVRLMIFSMEWMPAAHRMYAALGFAHRPDRDVVFPSGIGVCLQLDLDPKAANDGRFPAPEAVPPKPPWYEDVLVDERENRKAHLQQH